jgi:hypothetical protein
MEYKREKAFGEDSLTIKLWDLLGDCEGAWERFVRKHINQELADRVLLYRAMVTTREQ